MPASRVTVNTWAVEDADGNKLRRRIVAVLHAGEGGGSVDGLLIAKWAEATTDATTGIATFQLYSNDDIDQAGSFYSFTVCDVDPTVVRRYEIPAGAEVDLPDLTEVEPVGFSGYVPNPASGSDGDVLKVASDGTYQLGPISGASVESAETVRPLVLGADWCLVADRAIGVNRWADQGRAGIDGHLGGDAPAVVSSGSWSGVRLIGEWQSEVGATWPTLLDATYIGRLLPCQRDPANQWTEMALVTVDESEDLFEPGWVQQADGVHLGLDVRFDGESSERQWVSTGVLDDPHGEHTYRFTMDGTDLTAYVDGVEFESVSVASLPQNTPGTTDTAPFALYAPTAGTTLSVGRKAACTRSFTLLDDIGGSPLHSLNITDAADGDASITTAGETWTAYFGAAMAAPTDKRMLGSANVTFDDAPLVEIGTGDSFTWAFYGRPYGTGGQMASGNYIGYLFADDSGWLFGSVPAALSLPGLPTWGFSIGAGPEYAVDAGSEQDTDTAYVVVLDRSTDELRLYVDGTLVDTADVTGLGAVTATSVAYLPTGPGAHRWAAMWRRALDADEITYLTNGAGA